MSAPGFEDELDLLAAEYVLGTLDYRERAAFADRLRTEDAARRSVARWERRLDGLYDAVPPLDPPSEVWTRVERSLGAVRPFRILDGGGGGGRAARATALEASRNRWRAGALCSGLVAAALAIVLIGRNAPPVAVPSASANDIYVAAVNRDGEKPALIVAVDLRTRRVLVRPVAAETPPGRSLQLWYIAAGQAPRSMGLVDSGPRSIPNPIDASDVGSATVAVSVEPPGGSSTGGPTGPVIYSGHLIKE